MEVRVLKDEVVNKIAAGEVVERPASVVRELVDNSIDAGATDIVVRLEGGGRSLIEVSDNGFGMARDDALLCFERHATSKLKAASDLDHIHTLGFRGEALSSIAAVAKVALRTRRENDSLGTLVRIEGGRVISVDPQSCPVGTSIVVRRLFFNTPARRKFLRTPQTEEKRIRSWMSGAVLAYPQIRFRLISNDREVLNFPARSSLMERAKFLHRGSFVELDTHRGDMTVRGMVSHPGLAQLDAGSFTLLVNGRVIRDSLLIRAVRDGFASTLKSREFPIGFLSLTLDPTLVDVNVHPQKTEVRFHNNAEVFACVRDAVADAVIQFQFPVAETASRAVNQIEERKPTFAESPMAVIEARSDTQTVSERVSEVRRNEVQQPLAFSSFHQDPLESSGTSPALASGELPKADTSFRFSSLRYIGQALECYLFCESRSQVYVIDMHAAHERVNYERIRSGFEDRTLFSQQQLSPVTVTLGRENVEACIAQGSLLEKFGFSLEAFGDDTVLVRAAPSYLRPNVIRDCVREIASLASEHEEIEEEGMSGALSQILDRVCARLACHASVRSGKSMTSEEAYALFADLDQCNFSAACPHGRPIIIGFSGSDIERWFGRDR